MIRPSLFLPRGRGAKCPILYKYVDTCPGCLQFLGVPIFHIIKGVRKVEHPLYLYVEAVVSHLWLGYYQ